MVPSLSAYPGLKKGTTLQTALLEAQKFRDHRVMNGSQTKRASKDAREVSCF